MVCGPKGLRVSSSGITTALFYDATQLFGVNYLGSVNVRFCRHVFGWVATPFHDTFPFGPLFRLLEYRYIPWSSSTCSVGLPLTPFWNFG